jgi:hypothetical protein
VFLRLTISAFLLLSCMRGMAQLPTKQPAADSVFAYSKTIQGNFSDFTIDNLGNLYLVNQNGQVKKLTAAGDSVAVFNNVRQYGKIYLMDVTNPLKLLLYFKDFGTILILDRFLNTRAAVDLRRQQLFQVRAIGQSYDNNIWVFDELENKLKRISEEGRVLDQSTDFRLLFDSTPSPQYIVDQNKQLYLYDSAKGVYLFDYYGAFRNRIQLLGWTEFNVIGNVLYGRDAGMLYKYEPGTLNLQQYTIPAIMRKARKIKFTRDNLYLLREEGLEIYAINLRQ